MTHRQVVRYDTSGKGVWQVRTRCPQCGAEIHASGETRDGEPVPNPPVITCPSCGQSYTLELFYREEEDSQS